MKNILSAVFVSILLLISFSSLQAQYVVESSKQTHKYRNDNGKSSLEIEYKGEIKISDDDRAIVDISPNGFIYIKKKAFGNQRSIEITRRGRGLEYDYRVGNSRGSESEGKAWLSDVLLEVVRKSGIGVESRVERFMRRGGISALMREIDEIESSSTKRRYLDILMSNYDLNTRDLESVLTGVSTISSSSERGSFLRKHYMPFMQSDRIGTYFFETVDKISSSSEKGSILRRLLKDERLSTAKKIACLETTSRISSDSERGSVLRMMVSNDMLSDSEVTQAFFTAVNKISSSSERGSILRLILNESEGWNNNTSVLLFDAVSRISSSSEKGSILRKGAFILENPRAIEPYFDALNSISSDSERGSSLRAILSVHKSDLDNTTFIQIFQAVSSISSSSEKGSVLRLASNYFDQSNRAVMNEFKNAAESISSDSEYRSVMRAMGDQKDQY